MLEKVLLSLGAAGLLASGAGGFYEFTRGLSTENIEVSYMHDLFYGKSSDNVTSVQSSTQGLPWQLQAYSMALILAGGCLLVRKQQKSQF